MCDCKFIVVMKTILLAQIKDINWLLKIYKIKVVFYRENNSLNGASEKYTSSKVYFKNI